MSQVVNEISFSHNKMHFCALHSYWYQIFERFGNPFKPGIHIFVCRWLDVLDEDIYTEFRTNVT